MEKTFSQGLLMDGMSSETRLVLTLMIAFLLFISFLTISTFKGQLEEKHIKEGKSEKEKPPTEGF